MAADRAVATGTSATAPVACSGCGYDLREQLGPRPEGATCPECGRPVAASVPIDPARGLDPRRVRGTARALRAFALLPVLGLAVSAAGPVAGLVLAVDLPATGWLLPAALLATAALAGPALRPLRAGDPEHPARRRGVRACLLSATLLLVGLMVLQPTLRLPDGAVLSIASAGIALVTCSSAFVLRHLADGPWLRTGKDRASGAAATPPARALRRTAWWLVATAPGMCLMHTLMGWDAALDGMRRGLGGLPGAPLPELALLPVLWLMPAAHLALAVRSLSFIHEHGRRVAAAGSTPRPRGTEVVA